MPASFRNITRVFLSAAITIGLLCGSWLFSQETKPQAYSHYQNGLKALSLSDKIKFFEKALELDPQFLDANYQLGIAYFQKGQYKLSIQSLERTSQLSGGKFKEVKLYLRNAYTFYASALNEKSESETALDFAQQALEVDSSYAPAYAALGYAFFNLENRPSAITALKKSLTLDPNQELVWSKLGEIYLMVEDYHNAVQACEQALLIDPNLKEAQAHLKIADRRNTPEAWITRFEKLKTDGKLTEGIELLQQAEIIFPDNSTIAITLQESMQEYHYQNAVKAIEEGQWSDALESLQKMGPRYKDTALLLEEIKAAQAVRPDSLAAVAVVEKAPVPKVDKPVSDTAANKRTVHPAASELDLSSRNEAKTSQLIKSVNKILEDDITTQQVGTDSQAITDSISFGEISQIKNIQPIPAKVAMPARGPVNWYWIIGLAGSILMVALVWLSLGKANLRRPSRGEKIKRVTFNGADRESVMEGGDEFFPDRIASSTPVKFDPIDTTEILRDTENPQADAEISIRETQTILGGIKKIKRIGRYILEKEIGKGSMGLIYKAWDPKLDRTVVIKQVNFNFTSNTKEIGMLKDRLLREARAAGRLNHPNIVIIYDVDEEKDFSYIVMEYLQGNDLKLLLEKEVRLEPGRTVYIIRQICDALDYAHQMGIIHRDIKPSNIILTQNHTVKVADFGIAKIPNLGTLTQTGSIVGTPFYMSPEQLEGRKLDGRADIFSVGVILYEMLTGAHPFAGDSIPAVVYKIVHQQPKPPCSILEDLPKFLDDIVSRALAKDQQERYANAQELLADLEKVQGELLKHVL
jgi:tetratricopeptide (TPR) repeat protein/tRNA A-37 threonylcarbamoyl transferase component Bud32